MKRSLVTIGVIAVFSSACAVMAKGGIDEESLGLDKGSVFDTTERPAFDVKAAPPGGGNTLSQRSYPSAPPQIPHSIAGFTPVTLANNMGMSCHNTPDKIGKPRAEGQPVPIPKSHYMTGAYGKPAAGLKATATGDKVSGSRYVCTQCHRPQTNAQPLVESTFGK